MNINQSSNSWHWPGWRSTWGWITAPLAPPLNAGGRRRRLLAWLDPASATLNWPSPLTLLLFASVLSILFSVISQDNLQEIDRQTRQLAESEAQC